MAEDCGVDQITLHPRTRSQGYAGSADWSLVADLARILAIPVVGNGDVASADQAVDRLGRTGCAGVMIGRAALHEPWIFRDAEALLAGRGPGPRPDPAEIGRDLTGQIDDMVRWKGERKAVLEMRKFLAWAARGMAGAGQFRRIVQVSPDLPSLRREIGRFFCGSVAAEVGGRRNRGVGARCFA